MGLSARAVPRCVPAPPTIANWIHQVLETRPVWLNRDLPEQSHRPRKLTFDSCMDVAAVAKLHGVSCATLYHDLAELEAEQLLAAELEEGQDDVEGRRTA